MKKLKTSLLILFVIFLLASAGVVFLFLYQKTFNMSFPANTYISGIEIGGLKTDEAQTVLQNKVSELEAKSITFKYNNKSIPVLIKDLSPKFLIKETLSSIQLQDLTGNFLPQLLTKYPENKIPLIVKFDYPNIEKLLLEKFDIKDIGAKDSTFFFDEENNLSIKEELSGFKIDEEQLKTFLNENLSNFEVKDFEINLIEDVPAIKISDLESQKDEMLALLQNKIALIDPVFSDDWYIKLIDNPSWVIFTPDKTSKSIKIAIDANELNKYTDENVAKWLDRPAEDVNIQKNSEDKIEISGKGTDGTIIKRALFKEMLEKAANAKTSSVLIPIQPLSPKITVSKELSELGIKERIGVGHTSFYGSSANRVHNIKTGAEKFNGTLIAPGETFSFNTTLGPVNGSTGYRKELVIKKEGTIPEYGGGLCQVSTTVYRTILFSGLPVVDRRSHTYAVSYYSQILGHGLDATIYLGGQDLKFKNDTNNHILIQTYVDGNYELYITFYGTSNGRTVEMEGPYLSNYHSPGATQYIPTPTLAPGATKQVEVKHVGFTALWYRHLTNADGSKVKETIKSAYSAVPAKILVGAE